MINEKLAHTPKVEKHEQSEVVLKGIDQDVFAVALMKSPLDRYEEKNIKMNAQHLCLKHKDLNSLYHELQKRMPKISGRKKTLCLMEYVLAANYLEEKKTRKEIDEWNKKRDTEIMLIKENAKGRR